MIRLKVLILTKVFLGMRKSGENKLFYLNFVSAILFLEEPICNRALVTMLPITNMLTSSLFFDNLSISFLYLCCEMFITR